ETWPPGPNTSTGVGIKWTKAVVNQLFDDRFQKGVGPQMNDFAAVKLSSLPTPADTALLTELFLLDNQLWNINQNRVGSVAQQLQYLKGGASPVHSGKFNYL